MLDSNASNEKGFTLMEVLVAVVILAIGFSTILQLFSTGLASLYHTGEHTHAVFLAKEKMEEALLMEFSGIEEQIIHQSGELPNGYRWTLNVTPAEYKDADPDGLAWLFLIEVTIKWNNGIKQKQYQLQTLQFAKSLNGTSP